MFNYGRLRKIAKAGEGDLELRLQLQEAAILEIEAAIDRLQGLESHGSYVHQPRRKRQKASGRREPPRIATVDSWRPASRETKGELGRRVKHAQHESEAKEHKHQVNTIDRYLVRLDGGAKVSRLVGSFSDAQMLEP